MTISISTLSNGMTLILDPMPEVESVAYDLLIPGGLVTDPSDRVGASLILAELCARGAGDLASRELSDAFEQEGIGHSESASADRFGFRGVALAEKLPRALELTSLMVRAPKLPEEEVAPIQALISQDIQSLKDNPARWAMQELASHYFPEPWNRPSNGDLLGVQSSTAAELRSLWERVFRPKGAILSIAGKFDPEAVRNTVEQHFGGWTGSGVGVPSVGRLSPRRHHHVQHDGAQLQIALAFPSAKFGDPDFYTAKVASVVLSGGMFGRLFIEVREKRGLVYTVYSRHSANKEYGLVTAYAGTTPERAQETLSVMIEQIKGLSGTISAEELSRAKANVKASLVMSEESSGSRASGNGGDYWLGGRVRGTSEILDQINAVTTADIDQHLSRYPSQPFMLVTLGNKQIQAEV